jgi:hypothetical protein
MQVAMLLSTEGASTLTFAADTDSTVNSMGTFASIEMGKFNKMVKQISRTLAKLLQPAGHQRVRLHVAVSRHGHGPRATGPLIRGEHIAPQSQLDG